MGVSDGIISIIKGGLMVFLVVWFVWVGYWILKKTGILKLLIRKTKPSDEIYEEVAEKISEGKTLDDLAQEFQTKPKKIQDQYIEAYLEIKELEK